MKIFIYLPVWRRCLGFTNKRSNNFYFFRRWGKILLCSSTVRFGLMSWERKRKKVWTKVKNWEQEKEGLNESEELRERERRFERKRRIERKRKKVWTKEKNWKKEKQGLNEREELKESIERKRRIEIKIRIERVYKKEWGTQDVSAKHLSQPIVIFYSFIHFPTI
jgi:hypothetical protein